MSTVKLKFLGGPKDGGCQQIPSGDFHIGVYLLYPPDSGRGAYLSDDPYEGLETEVAMEFYPCFEIGTTRIQKIN